VQPDRPVQTTLAFHASRIVIDVGVLITMAAMSLPFVVSDLGDRSALEADALPAVLLLLPIFAVTLIPDHTRPLHPVASWVSLVLGLAALPYAIVKLLDAGILADTLDGSLGLGAYALIVGTITTVVGIAIGLYRDLRGLPAGGTPRRSNSYKTKRQPQRPRRDPAAGTQSGARQGSAAAPADESSDDEETATARRTAQPEIVAADAAPARDAESEVETTAERADAAIDNDILAMFDDEEPDGTS